MDLLDEGTLYVAKFNDDGTGEWLPLVFGEGELTEANGFTSQADVLVRARFAADAVGATKMDRPEDFETNPVTGKVYLVCTNNSNRTWEETIRSNPRPENYTGHIIELTEAGNDHGATTFDWAMFILAGDPAAGGTYYGGFDTGAREPVRLAGQHHLRYVRQPVALDRRHAELPARQRRPLRRPDRGR